MSCTSFVLCFSYDNVNTHTAQHTECHTSGGTCQVKEDAQSAHFNSFVLCTMAGKNKLVRELYHTLRHCHLDLLTVVRIK